MPTAALLPDDWNLLYNCCKLSQENLKNYDDEEAVYFAKGLQQIMKGMARGRNVHADPHKAKLLVASVDTALHKFETHEEWRAQFQPNELEHEIAALKRLQNKLNPRKPLPFGGTIRRMPTPLIPKGPTEDEPTPAPPKIALKRDGLWRTVSL
jgi:hypothetical protein